MGDDVISHRGSGREPTPDARSEPARLRSLRLEPGRTPRAILSTALLLLTAACGPGGDDPDPATALSADADPAIGAALIREYGCGTCHTIPGVRSAIGMVGPPLTNWAHRAYIAGALANTPANLRDWIVDPQVIEPGTAMPSLGVTPAQASHIAAYLYTLR